VCLPDAYGGSTIDYGNIPASSLNTNSGAQLPTKHTSLSIVCDSPVKFGFTNIDERPGTAVIGIGDIPPIENASWGLGSAVNGAKIGAYNMFTTTATSDSGSTQILRSVDGGNTYNNFIDFRSDGTSRGRLRKRNLKYVKLIAVVEIAQKNGSLSCSSLGLRLDQLSHSC
jgi:hypothetical protein